MYIFLIYLIIKRLTRRLKLEFNLIKAEENKRQSMFLRGLAHDVKTPLSTIITYSKALEDGIVKENEVGDYYKVIYSNGIILKERVENMLSLTTLGDEGIFSIEEGDVLEEVRRFIGENYSWFVKNDASINVEISDDAKFITKYDKKLLHGYWKTYFKTEFITIINLLIYLLNGIIKTKCLLYMMTV